MTEPPESIVRHGFWILLAPQHPNDPAGGAETLRVAQRELPDEQDAVVIRDPGLVDGLEWIERHDTTGDTAHPDATGA